MGEFIFVGLGVFVWTVILCLVLGSVCFLVVMFHVIRIEFRHYKNKRREKLARFELDQRKARLRRNKELDAKAEEFFDEIDRIVHDL